MKKKKVLIVFGTRPEAIKMAPLIKEFQKYPEKFHTIVCVTAQHREMLDQVLNIFEISPDYDLNLMKSGQDLYDITSKVLMGMRDILDKVSPDLVFVHGDTTTSSATALASFYKQIPIAHVEAGLRTYDIYSPWPEEINRQITGRIAEYHFAPTTKSKNNLINEHVPENRILVTGNTVIDALHMVLEKLKFDYELQSKQIETIRSKGYFLKKGKKILLVTGHRRENFGQGFINICDALGEIAKRNPELDIVYPVHLNPNVQEPVNRILANIDNIYLIDPLDYMPFLLLMSESFIVLTDSGGIQEEAPSIGKPVLVMRNTTERPEAVESGTVVLVGTRKDTIINEVEKLLIDKSYYQFMTKIHNPYGSGKACETIVSFVDSLNVE